MMNQEPTYTIHEVSRELKLPKSTLRYYEEINLLDPVVRGASGHRQYTQADLMRLNLIKNLRLTGMSIEQMQDFIALYKGGEQTAAQRRTILQAHRQVVQAHVDELFKMLDFIDYKISLYQQEEATYEQRINPEHQDEIPALR